VAGRTVLEVGVSTVGLHEECPRGFKLTRGLKRLLLYVGGERGTIVLPGLQTIADAIVFDGLHTIVADLVKF
jgi:hypothetical protein